MRIFKFELQGDVDYEMYDGFVIIARTAIDARKILKDRLVDTLTEGREGDYHRTEIFLDDAAPGIVLESNTGA